MTKLTALFSSVIVAGFFAATTAAPARAETVDKLTFLTFSRPVQVPGAMLDAGTYRFRLTNPETSRNVLQVLSRDGSTVYSMFHTIPDSRPKATFESTVTFRETPAGVPPAIRSLFYGGELRGYEFVYPKGSLMMTTEKTLQQTEVTYTPEPVAQTITKTEEVAQAEPAPAPAAPPPPAPEPQAPAPVATSGELPKTATQLPWVAFGGLSSLIMGLGMRLFGRRLT